MNTPKKPNPKIPNMVQLQNTTQRLPIAPPVYRPQPVPKVLQTKRPPGQTPQPFQAARPPIGPPVYRPEIKTVQPKIISAQRPSPPQPPVYRPQQNGVAQRRTAAPAHPMPPAPAVHRPQPKVFAQPSVIQRSGGKKTKEEEEKKARRRQRYTRIIRLDQLNRQNIGVNTTRKSRGSLERNLPLEFAAKGRHTTRERGLYSYMRMYGGAGMQGVHRGVEGESRGSVVHGVLSKMAQDPNRRHGRRGPKFAMIGIDPTRLNADNILDTTTRRVRRQFARRYGGRNSESGKNFMNMYDRHADEGVVAVVGGIPLDAIIGLRAFRNVPDEDDLEQIIEELVMSEDEGDGDDILTPDCKGGPGFDGGPGGFGGGPGGFGGGPGFGGGLGSGPGITA